MLSSLRTKLMPSRNPGMSPQLAAIVGLLVGDSLTEPRVDSAVVTPAGEVFLLSLDERVPETHRYFPAGALGHLSAQLHTLATTAGLTSSERRDFDALIRMRLAPQGIWH